MLLQIKMSSEILQLQVWILGGVISVLLIFVIALLKANMADIKQMLEDHENRIAQVERHRDVSEERHKNSGDVIREIKGNITDIRTKLDLLIDRG